MKSTNPPFLALALSFSAAAYADSSIELVPLVSGLVNPLYVTHSGDGSGRLFIVEQAGRILVFQSGTLLSSPFLDIRSRVTSGGERGLLGLAFHPDFKSDRRFFVNYTRTDGGQLKTVVAEYRASSSDANVADVRETVILEFNQPFANHNGGHLAFGPDGYLYIATGDGGSGGDPQGNGQNKNTWLGKILRIDVDRAFPYAIPPDNPLAGVSNVKQEIWAYGLRNPWRFSFDRSGGRLFAGDVGQNAWEEIDIVTKGGNYGWNVMEGAHCFPASVSSCNTTDLILPIAEYGRSEGISVTGGYVYRGRQVTSLRGAYLFGDFGSTRIWALQEEPSGEWKRTELLRTGLAISSFGEDEAGEIYVVHHGSINAANGAVFRIQFRSRLAFAQVGDGISVVGIFKSTLILINNSSQPAGGEIRFYASDGFPLALPVSGATASRLSFTLNSKSSKTFVTDGNSSPIAVGWAEILSDYPLQGTILYTLLSVSGEPLAEAGLEASTPGRELAAHVARGASFDTNTGIALANPSATDAAQVTLTINDRNGNPVAGAAFSLGPRQHSARFLHEVGAVGADFEGTLLVSSTGDLVATLLRTKSGIQFSSLPVAK